MNSILSTPSIPQPDCSLLLVDDDEEFLEIVVCRFTRHGYDVMGALTPAGALTWAERRRFDVAVVDRSLPGMDGFALTERLREINGGLQVIVLSGHADATAEARRRGACNYLVKPCSLAELEAAVQSALGAAPLPA